MHDIREHNRASVLKQSRIKLHEVEQSLQSITIQEMKQLALDLKKRKSIKSLCQIKKGACGGDEHIQAFLRSDGALAALVGILIGTDAEKQLEAAACLTNLVSGSHKSTFKIAKAAGAYLVTFINGKSHFLQDQCTWAAGNIANDCETCYNLLKAQGIIPALLSLLQSGMQEVTHSACFALSVCTKYEDLDIITSPLIEVSHLLLNVITCENTSRTCLSDASYALSNCLYMMVDYSHENFDQGICSSVLDFMCKVLKSSIIDILVATPLVRCLGYLTSSSECCKFLSSSVEFRFLSKTIITSEFHHLKNEFLWILGNVFVTQELSPNDEIVVAFLENVVYFCNPLNDAVVQALHNLIILSHKEVKICHFLLESGIVLQLNSLLNCDKKHVEETVKILLSVIHSET